MAAWLLAGTQFFLVLGSIWKTCARVVKMGCSLWGERRARERTEQDFMCHLGLLAPPPAVPKDLIGLLGEMHIHEDN